MAYQPQSALMKQRQLAVSMASNIKLYQQAYHGWQRPAISRGS